MTKKPRTPKRYGRQAKGKTIVSLSLTLDTAQRARAEAKRRETSLSAFVETVLRANAVSVESTALLGLVADIRAAVGDPTGKFMQDELVQHCAEMLDRVTRAEAILERLAMGYWVHVLNEHSEGENIGDQVLDYWRKYNEPNAQADPPRESR